MALSAHEKKLFILWRLVEKDDRLVRQRPSQCGTFPDSVWFLLPPQLGPGEMLGAAKWLERQGYIIESIAPTAAARKDGHTPPNELRRYYQGDIHHRVYAASPAGVEWYWGTA